VNPPLDTPFWDCTSKASAKTFIDIGPLKHEAAMWFPVYGVHTYSVDPAGDFVNFANFGKMLSSVASAGGQAISQNAHHYYGGVSDVNSSIVTGLGDARYLHPYVISDIVKERIGCFKIDCDGCEGRALLGAICLACDYGIDRIFSEYYPSSHPRRGRTDPIHYLTNLSRLGFECYFSENERKSSSFPSIWGSQKEILHDPYNFTELMLCQGNWHKRCLEFVRKGVKWRHKLDMECERMRPPDDSLCFAHGCRNNGDASG
jgi:hypothetical protein